MNQELAVKQLIYSLNRVSEFSGKKRGQISSEEFIELHNTNICSLKDLSKIRNTDYFANQIKEYPEIDSIEVEQFVKNNHMSSTTILLLVFGGWTIYLPYLLIKYLIGVIKTKGNSIVKTDRKLEQIRHINKKLIYVVERPGFEEMIEANNNNT